MSFQLEAELKARLDPAAIFGFAGGSAAVQVPSSLRLRSRLHWRVLEERPEGWEIMAALSEVSLQPTQNTWTDQQEQAFQEPFLLSISRDCRFGKVEFRPGFPDPLASWIRQLVAALEFTLPSRMTDGKWVATHRDQAGLYVASYVRDLEADPLTLRKQRVSYSTPVAQRLTLDIVSSEMEIQLDPAGRWARRIRAREHLRIHVDPRGFNEVEGEVQLVALAGSALPARLLGWTKETLRSPFTAADGASDPSASREATSALSGPETLEPYLRQLEAKDSQTRKNALERIAALLRSDPALLCSWIELLRRAGVSSETNAYGILALKLAGSREAQQVLVEILASSEWSEVHRIRAAIALSGVSAPIPQTVDALLQLTRQLENPGRPGSLRVAHTALLGLGTLVTRLQPGSEQQAEKIHRELARLLVPKGNNALLMSALDAAANTADSRYAKSICTLSHHESPRVRSRAVLALAQLGTAAADSCLAERMTKESDTAVRTDLAGVLQVRARANAGVLEPAIIAESASHRLAAEPDTIARTAWIRLLGTLSLAVPSARQALIRHFKIEPEPTLQVLIGTYIPAKELVPGR